MNIRLLSVCTSYSLGEKPHTDKLGSKHIALVVGVGTEEWDSQPI